MLQFSQMKFSRKIFLAIFGTATGAAVFICLLLYGTLSTYRVDEFEDSYVDHMKLLAKALVRIEESQARIALNAAEVLKLQQEEGPLSGSELKTLAKSLAVTRINLYDKTGKPRQSSDALGDSLFEIFPEVQAGTTDVFQSPLLRGKDGQVGIHTVVASPGRKSFVEVVIYFDDAVQLLREMVQHDEDNLSIELVGADNQTLGHIQQEGFQRTWDLQTVLQWKEGAHWVDDKMVIVTSVKNENGKHDRLISTISARTLKAELHKIQRTLLAVAAALILLSWWLSQVLTKTLLRKVQSLRSLLNQISSSQDYSKRVAVEQGSQDELDDLGQSFNNMLSTLQSHQTRLIDAERDKARTQVAAQVAHDIRSPLMSMNMALSQIESAQLEPLAILKSAVARVASIVQKLSASSEKPEEPSGVEAPKLTLMEPWIVSVLNEHRVRKLPTQELKITGLHATPHIWSVVQVNELQTALSNMINNAFEAGATEVSLHLTEAPKEWSLQVKDNGKGIPSAVVEKIFERSFTFGKTTGTGLGLYQAKAAVEWSGGTLEVSSSEGQGTTFTLRLPREKNPAWLPAFIELEKTQTILFVDDDKNVLNAWRDKVSPLGIHNPCFFSSVQELETYIGTSALPESALIVIDQNLGDGKKGLDVLKELSLGQRAYLCTSEFDEKWIQDQIKKLNGYLIPKPWISQFEIRVRT
ncbi:HAMP domain-containing sensor histidine kinase [Bdellovibrio sp. 22V]|uniref:ATP-binding protein n=1 Tax=Bdellovibrio TaxID=958 RepID=UPI0025431343|nr:HAMP domain-containing sensor histidine kinase [Bdellovibrio sp. 22V]WII72360.1 HAMP domain-containing sensor histidine kinase [Bdellovibrio sp. 22V]